MAHPEGPSDSNRGEGGGAGAKELSPDDFERLASIFRPSWKLDDAPVTAGASFSRDEVQALQGRAPSNGIHGTPIVVVEDAPITAPARAPRPGATIVATPPPPDAQPTTPSLLSQGDAVALPGTRTTTSSWPPRPPGAPAPDAATVPPAQRPTVPSWTAEGAPASQRPHVPSWTDDDRSPFSPPAIIPSGPWASRKSAAAPTEILRRGPRSRTPMWIGLGAVVVATGIGLWIWTRGSEPPTPAPSAPEVAKTVVQAPVAPILPAPTVTAAPSASVAAPAASEPPPKPEEAPPAAASASPPPAAVVEPTPRPVVAPAPAPKPTPAPKAAPGSAAASPITASPAPKPAPRPKPGAQTIVHDVPF